MKVILAIAIYSLLLGCKSPDRILQLGGVRLADVDAHVAVSEGARVELRPEGDLPAIPAGAKLVQIAADRETPFGRLRALSVAIEKTGAVPQVLVSVDAELGALPPNVPAVAESILLAVEKAEKMKACIAPPGSEERMCVTRSDGKHVERALVRELVRDAVKAYGLTAVHVRPGDDVPWIEVARAIDGARTCCKGTEIKISVEGATL